LLGVFNSIGAKGKACEEEGQSWLGEEFLFSFLTVFIHCVSDNLEVYVCPFHQTADVLLLKMV